MPCASASPARIPVNEPGPTVTATRSIALSVSTPAVVQHLSRHDGQDRLMALLRCSDLGAAHGDLAIDHDRGGASRQSGIQDQNAHPRGRPALQARMQASSKSSRGERLNTPLQSP